MSTVVSGTVEANLEDKLGKKSKKGISSAEAVKLAETDFRFARIRSI